MQEYILIAGANGVGKSTIYGITPDLKDLPYINPDRYAHAGDIRGIFRAIDRCFCSNLSFVQETTLCGQTILKNIRRAKEAGYELTIHYIGVEDVEIARRRIRARAAKGGHDIADRDIDRRFAASFQRIHTLIPTADRIYFYDNTERFRKIAKYDHGNPVWEAAALPRWYRDIS